MINARSKLRLRLQLWKLCHHEWCRKQYRPCGKDSRLQYPGVEAPLTANGTFSNIQFLMRSLISHPLDTGLIRFRCSEQGTYICLDTVNLSFGSLFLVRYYTRAILAYRRRKIRRDFDLISA